MAEDKIITIIELGKNALDNYYTIYESERINRVFDRNYYDFG